MSLWQVLALACGFAVLVATAAAAAALLKAWGDDDPGKDRPRLVVMVLWILVFSTVGTLMAWRSAQVLAPPHLPERAISAWFKEGTWTFASSSGKEQRDLHLIAGQPVRLQLSAQNHGEFFVPSLGLRQRLKPGENVEIRFRPAGAPVGEGMAVHHSVCNHRCSGVQPFLVVVRDEQDAIKAY